MSRTAVILWALVGIAILFLLVLLLIPVGVPEPEQSTDDLFPTADPVDGLQTLPRARSIDALLSAPDTVRLGQDDYLFLQTTKDSRYEPQPYQITYHAPDRTFTITVMQEPLGHTRRQAEAIFLAMLGLSKIEACVLRVNVTVPWSVNQRYAGQNLGMSFCPGATALPE
jgi:hypothetical protein